MRKLLIVAVAALLVTGLIAAATGLPSRSASARLGAIPRAQTLRAHALFKKYLSSHATLIRAHASTSIGAPRMGTAHPVSHSVTSNGVQELGSINWGGYADLETGSDTATGVSGSWTIPKVTCPSGTYKNQDAFASQWVGLDGATTGTVEQLGSGEQCYEGVLYYYVWYEMFPGGTVQEGTQACINNNVDCPRPGDRITASVTSKPGDPGDNNYTLTLKDHGTAGNNFSVTKPCDTDVCLDQSAEWIIERPAFAVGSGFQILPLVYYGKNSFTHGTVTSGGKTTSIAGFTGGIVADVATLDDSEAYFLQCMQQEGPPGQLLLTSDPNACPVASPRHGDSFTGTWDSSF